MCVSLQCPAFDSCVQLLATDNQCRELEFMTKPRPAFLGCPSKSHIGAILHVGLTNATGVCSRDTHDTTGDICSDESIAAVVARDCIGKQSCIVTEALIEALSAKCSFLSQFVARVACAGLYFYEYCNVFVQKGLMYHELDSKWCNELSNHCLLYTSPSPRD